MIKSNLHTHSVFCDGKDTIEEMTQKAISLGFTSLGFSGHCYTGVTEDTCGMSLDGTKKYLAEIERVDKKYSEIKLFKGLEIEASYPYPTKGFDYSILSCHFSRTPSGLKSIDYTREVLEEIIKEFGGVDLFFEDYFSQLVSAVENGVDSQIIGHFDLYTKFDEQNIPLFEAVPQLAFDTMEYFVKKDKIFEINTGAIGRGYRTKPYPSIPLLKHLKSIGGKITVSSDCHNKDYLSVYFNETRELLLSLDFKTQMELTEDGFKEIEL